MIALNLNVEIILTIKEKYSDKLNRAIVEEIKAVFLSRSRKF